MKNKTRIVRYPSVMLSTAAEEVFYSKEYFAPKQNMFRMACLMNNGVGLAAPQLGISKRFFWYDYDGERFMAINPVIHYFSDEVDTQIEGCLSVPGKEFSITRFREIGRWEYTDIDGNRVEEKDVRGHKARIIQHECDHLDGICLPDITRAT